MKIALITDTHFGARSDSIPFDKFFEKFYREKFFPELEKRQIKTIIHLGDIFDRRKFINFNTYKSCREYFFDKVEELEIDMHMIPGNHDTYFKNTNEVNSPELLLKDYSCVHIYPEVTKLSFDGRDILFTPWICSDNYRQTMEAIDETDATVCFGHYELAGFQMYKGHANDHGMDPKIFDKFQLVCSGHFHHRSSNGNITYLGNPYEITWSDYDDPRGFHIYDTRTNELEFIQNPFNVFHKFYYNDADNSSGTDIDAIDYSSIANGSVKVVVVQKSDFGRFDAFIDKLESCDLIELKIIEDFSEFEDDAIDTDNLNLEDTITLLDEYIDNINTDLDRKRLKDVVKGLYVEAKNL
tara:strand:- start:10701 stop:11762 length:1062 start_codon:yes stop_codon:yes gene_type:complete